jgi:hypothetical protein
MNNVIRKISIGSDYKNDAIHNINSILFDELDSSYNIYIKKNDEVMPWKKFNSNMAISVEYDLKY